MNLNLETFNGLLVRRGAQGQWDRGISSEVQHEYHHADLKAAKVLVDIGAHIGAYVVHAKRVNPDLEVIAVEANAENAAILRMNTVNLQDVTVFHARCGYKKHDDPVLLCDSLNTGGCTVCERRDAETYIASGTTGCHLEEVPILISLEDVFGEVERVNVLKIDAEGAEFDILPGAKPATLKRVDCIVGEWHQTKEVFEAQLVKPMAKLFDLVEARQTDQTLGYFCFKRK